GGTALLESGRPGSSADRVGAQVGLTWKSVNRTPSAWSRSRFGVFSTGLPWHDRSPYPWSSVRTKTTFGFSADRVSPRRAQRAQRENKSLKPCFMIPSFSFLCALRALRGEFSPAAPDPVKPETRRGRPARRVQNPGRVVTAP